MTKTTKRDSQWDDAHGRLQLPSVSVDSYSLELREDGDLIGDQASQTAFRQVLDEWRDRLTGRGDDPFGDVPTVDLSKKQIDRAAVSGDPIAQHTVDLAVEEFSQRVAHVASMFLQQKAWRGVQRIVVGGGFKQSAIGEHTIHRTEQLLRESNIDIEVVPLTHEADDGGLIGWVHLAPPELLADCDGMLAVDIGGTNVRCGILMRERSLPDAHVVERKKWRHADEGPGMDLIEGIVEMLEGLIAKAKKADIALSPFIGVGCPGIIRADGSIARGAQNLPEDWQGASFHLPRRLQENIAEIAGRPTVVQMHNDAVVQGLSALPFMGDVERWAVLTIGTGLGNASFTNVRPPA